VFALLGSGGMGEVYKARDLRLGRSVALKVIHAHVAQEPALRERFEREARAVSSLNHPHICTLYDVGQHEGSEFLVMEFVEGETLAERLTRGPLPLGLAIQCAIEIAKGLDHAHRHGITHRDLKPANVILARTGAKLLDFGLAKLRDSGTETTRSLDSGVARLETQQRQTQSSTSNVVTTHGPLTEVGTVLGTFEYMAPEQMEGREADERTDVFAFGAIVYEAVTGRRAFQGQTRASLIGAVLMTEPPSMREGQPAVPILLDSIVRRCLSKDPEERWQSVRDLLVALQWVADGVTPVDSRTERTRRGRLIAALVLAAVAAGVLAWDRIMAPTDRSDAAVTRWEEPVPGGVALAAELVPSVAVSPDGSHLVFRAEAGGASRLYLRRLTQFEARPIEGSEGAYSPFFSPDGTWVGFLAKSKIYRAAVTGGPALPIADAQSLSPGSPGVTWGPDGTIVFAAGVSGLMHVSEGGGVPAPLTTPDCARGEVAHVGPQFLPGGRELLFSIRMADGAWRIAVLSLATRRWDLLPAIGDVAGARYVSTGHVIYAQSGSLTAIPIDLSRRTFMGPPKPLSEPVYTRTVADAVVAQFAVSDGGLLAYVSGRPPNWTLVSVRPGEAPRPLGDASHLFRYPRVSRDGSSVAVSIEEERTDIYVMDAALGRLRRLTDTGSNTQPVWTPDSQRVTFASRRGGSCGWDLYSVRVDSSEAAERILERDGGQFPTSWLASGAQLAFYELTQATARDVWVWFAAEKHARAVDRAASPANERGATFSHDGRLLAYVSNELGGDDIYVQAYPGPGGREVVSLGGGTEPVWSPTAYELFYRNGDRLFAVTIRTEPKIAADTPRVLFTGSYVPSPTETGLPNYDVFPDGRRFVMVRSATTSEMHVHVIQNWFEQLRTSD
jgi:serine/threonine-protein kinase